MSHSEQHWFSENDSAQAFSERLTGYEAVEFLCRLEQHLYLFDQQQKPDSLLTGLNVFTRLLEEIGCFLDTKFSVEAGNSTREKLVSTRKNTELLKAQFCQDQWRTHLLESDSIAASSDMHRLVQKTREETSSLLVQFLAPLEYCFTNSVLRSNWRISCTTFVEEFQEKWTSLSIA